MSTPRNLEYKILIEDIIEHHIRCRKMGLPGLSYAELKSLGEIVNGGVSKMEKDMAEDEWQSMDEIVVRVVDKMATAFVNDSPPEFSKKESADKNKNSDLSANPEINPFEE
jgi:hypothetical protein